jgi:benzil reductase ((S)-benzoin forming)
MAIGRRLEPLSEVAKVAPEGAVVPLSADVSTAAGRAAIVAAVKEHFTTVDFLVQNAGTLGPIAPLGGLDEKGWEAAFATNVHGPLFLLQALVGAGALAPGSRVLHIGSGAAHRAIGGWTAYCASKAAFYSMYQCLSAELRPAGILLGSVRPGIVDTPMQAVIRDASEAAMPEVGKFRAFHEKMPDVTTEAPAAPPSDSLDRPENVAAFLSFLLQGTDADEYVADEWDIRDASHHERWIGAE